jgi:hypothetical protein
VTPAIHTDYPSCQVSATKPYVTVSGQKIYDLARESGLVISVSDSSITKAETSMTPQHVSRRSSIRRRCATVTKWE